MEAPQPWQRPEGWPLPIVTERLVLRAPTHEDARAVFNAVESNRQNLSKWMPWARSENISIGQAHYTIERFIRDLNARPPANMPIFICDRTTGAYLGGTGLHDFHADTHQAETGYWITQERRGQGVCTEAVVALTQASLRSQSQGGLGLRRIEIRCSADNMASARVAQKAGYTLEGRLRAHRWIDGIGWSDTLIYATTADTWTKP